MRICLAPSAFAPAKGGVEELTLKLAQHLQRLGHDVLVVVNRHPADLPERSVVEGVDVVRLEMPPPGRRPRNLLRFLAAMRRVPRSMHAEGFEPDLLHVMCPSSQLAPLARWARRARLPVVITSQGETEMDANALYQRSRWMRGVLRREAARARALSACSSWTAERASRVAPAFTNADVILNGVDPQDWQTPPAPEDPVVCAWGRHVPQKGLDLLLDAFPLVREKVPDARLLLGGDGPDHALLRAKASDGVELLGSLDRSQVRDMLGSSRVAVVPSRVEPFGIVAVEALAARRGLVYSTNGGLGEAAGGLGIGVDVTDRRALADAVVEMLHAPVDGDRAFARAEELSWENLAARYVALYERALAFA